MKSDGIVMVELKYVISHNENQIAWASFFNSIQRGVSSHVGSKESTTAYIQWALHEVIIMSLCDRYTKPHTAK